MRTRLIDENVRREIEGKIAMIPLNQIHVPEPCGQDWEAMDGDAQKRLCAGCGCHVHDLSAMTATDAQSVLDNAVGRLCVRYETRPDGTPLTLDDAPTPERRVFWTRRLATAASWALALAVTGLGLTTVRTEAAPQKTAHAKSKPHAKLKPHAVPVVPQRPHRFLGRVVPRHPNNGQGQPTVAAPSPPPTVIMGMGAPPPLPPPPTTMTGESGGSLKK
jgi:hypothetical protein